MQLATILVVGVGIMVGGVLSVTMPQLLQAGQLGDVRHPLVEWEYREPETKIYLLTEDTSEVTEEYSDLQARLRNVEATEAQYLELLASAESITDVLLVQDRLNSVRLEIEQVQGRIQLLDDLTSMATITTFLSLPPLIVLPVDPEAEQSWATEAWENAWNASEDALETLGVAAITGGVVLVWLLIPGALMLGGWWVFTARRRTGDTAA